MDPHLQVTGEGRVREQRGEMYITPLG